MQTIEEFRATAHPVSCPLWQVMLTMGVTEGLPSEAFTEYEGGYVLHEVDGGFYPHAWWYAPVRRETRAEAEAVLWEWRKEWV